MPIKTKFKQYQKPLLFLVFMALTMDPRLKLKNVLFSMKQFYMNICINKNDDDVTKEKAVRDDLEKNIQGL